MYMSFQWILYSYFTHMEFGVKGFDHRMRRNKLTLIFYMFSQVKYIFQQIKSMRTKRLFAFKAKYRFAWNLRRSQNKLWTHRAWFTINKHDSMRCYRLPLLKQIHIIKFCIPTQISCIYLSLSAFHKIAVRFQLYFKNMCFKWTRLISKIILFDNLHMIGLGSALFHQASILSINLPTLPKLKLSPGAISNISFYPVHIHSFIIYHSFGFVFRRFKRVWTVCMAVWS